MTPTLVQVTFAEPYLAAVTLTTFAALGFLTAGATAIVYRWYFRSAVPEGVAILLGITTVALYLNTTSLGEVVSEGDAALLTPEGVFFNVVALGVAGAVSPAGRYVGDRLAVDTFALTGTTELEGNFGSFAKSFGRFTVVTLPPAEEIADMETYEPVPAEKKEVLAEKNLLFPRRLDAEELRERLIERIKTEHGIGHVDTDLTADGTLEYFAVGSRATGLGPTLAPGTAGVAVAADPPHSATSGDMVQIWRADPETKRIATGELRGVAGDVVTVALDESDAETLSVEGGYRIVTLPSEPQADREFASLLRNADETMSTATVREGSKLVGTAVGEVTAVVAAIQPPDESVQAIPPRAYTFAAGDTVYLVGRPDAIRRFETAASTPVDPGSTVSPSSDDDPSTPQSSDDDPSTPQSSDDDPSTPQSSGESDPSEIPPSSDPETSSGSEPPSDSDDEDRSGHRSEDGSQRS